MLTQLSNQFEKGDSTTQNNGKCNKGKKICGAIFRALDKFVLRAKNDESEVKRSAFGDEGRRSPNLGQVVVIGTRLKRKIGTDFRRLPWTNKNERKTWRKTKKNLGRRVRELDLYGTYNQPCQSQYNGLNDSALYLSIMCAICPL